MDTLAEWLKQIILVVLLATFIDLLLPNSTMQRYVKLVVSLFILMTILTPVMNLLGSNANLRMLAASVDDWSAEGTPSGIGGSPPFSIPALSAVLAEGDAVRKSRERGTLDALESRLEAMVKQQVAERYGIRQMQVESKLAFDSDGLPAIEQIRIVLGAADRDDPEASSMPGMHPVDPVKPIQPVEVEPVGGRIWPEPEPDAAAAAERTWSRRQEHIRREVASQWSVDEKRVIVERQAE